MRHLLAALLLLLAAAPAAAQRYASEVTVTRDGSRWTAEFRFTGRAQAWMFIRTEPIRGDGGLWRQRQWRVETPGVRLEHRGRHDALVATNGRAVPARVRISFTPAAVDLDAGYDPALVFTDGSVALYTKQFATVPRDTAEEIDRLPGDLNGLPMPEVTRRLTFRDAGGPVLLAGERLARASFVDGENDGTYVLFGRLQPVITPAMAQIVDPALPAWIRASLNRSVPQIIGLYAATLGPPPPPKPTILVSWGGATEGRTSLGGSVLPGMVTLAYEGQGLATESAGARGYGLWFIAHESAHFWLGNLIAYQYARDAWITEGGAELLAYRTVPQVDPAYDWRTPVNQAIAQCATFIRGRGVVAAADAEGSRPFYDCGTVFALIAEASSRRPFIHFVRGLIDANRADHQVTRADWFGALDRVSGDPTLSRDIGVLLDRGADDPAAAIASLLRRANLAFTLGPNGVPRLS